MNEICTRIKELRKNLELSQVDFSKRLGVSNAHISKIEKGKTIPSDLLVKLISKEYKVNENWIKTGTEPVFIYEILDKAEIQLEESASTFSKLLSSDSYIIRSLAAELKFYFSNITDPYKLDDDQIIEYLTIIKDMFSKISYYNSVVKDSIYSNQFSFGHITEQVFKKYKNDIAKDIDQLEDLIKKC